MHQCTFTFTFLQFYSGKSSFKNFRESTPSSGPLPKSNRFVMITHSSNSKNFIKIRNNYPSYPADRQTDKGKNKTSLPETNIIAINYVHPFSIPVRDGNG